MELGSVQEWISVFSYPAVLLLLLSAGLGAPVSEELILIAGGIAVAKSGATLPAMLVVAYLGVLCGDLLLFRIGRRMGPRALRLRWLRRAFTPSRVEKVRAHFDRHGALTVLAARFLPGFRAVTFLTAGTSGMPLRRFVVADALGAAIVVPLLVGLSARFGPLVLERLERVTGVLPWAVLGGLGLLLGVRLWRARRLARSRAASAGRPALPFEPEGEITGSR